MQMFNESNDNVQVESHISISSDKRLSDICSFKVVCVKNVILCLSRLSHKMLHNQNKKGLMKPTVCIVSILEVVYKLFSATCSRQVSHKSNIFLSFQNTLQTDLTFSNFCFLRQKDKTELKVAQSFCKYCCNKKNKGYLCTIYNSSIANIFLSP